MVREGATVCPTVSGAMRPLGFGGVFRDPVEHRFVDRAITTGAGVCREDYAWGLPVRQGHHIDDAKLYENDSPDTVRVHKVLREPRPKTGRCRAPCATASAAGRSPRPSSAAFWARPPRRAPRAPSAALAAACERGAPAREAVRKAARAVRKAQIRPRLGPRAARRQRGKARAGQAGSGCSWHSMLPRACTRGASAPPKRGRSPAQQR